MGVHLSDEPFALLTLVDGACGSDADTSSTEAPDTIASTTEASEATTTTATRWRPRRPR